MSFGTWAIGGAWGDTQDDLALRALDRAIDAGVNFFDTADVYGDGRAERLLERATRSRRHDILIATKFCKAGDATDRETYSYESVRAYCEGSLSRLSRETIDLYQIHCPPKWVIDEGDVFEVLDRLQQEGKIRYYGVSVETVDEGLSAIQYPRVKSLQVIINIFRQKPFAELVPKCEEQGIGVLARLPLASGLLTGKFKVTDTFAKDDHRNFNRDGQQFNVGETFAGLPFEKGVALADELRWISDGRGNMTHASLRWILDQMGVTCVIPGFKNETQVEDNLEALNVPSFTDAQLQSLQEFYRDRVHAHIRGAY